MTETDLRKLLTERISGVERRIRAACSRAGRPRSDVTLVAVTKTIAPEIAALLPELGLMHLAESRPQELWRKAAALPSDIKWHLVGHLQRNKIERTLPLVQLIHSIDSLRLLEALEQEAAAQGRNVPVLLEANVSQESSKHGFAPSVVAELGSKLRALRHVQVQGLMTMAAFDADPQTTRPTFVALRKLCDELRLALASPTSLPQLSMGMSNDFEVAIEEGATLVRVGTALFEGLANSRP
jgi:pyridoxal phosphate enzyme (YggS family)